MNEKYKKYLIENWKDAEELAKECGCSDNRTVNTMFGLLSQPYYYWLKSQYENKKNDLKNR